MDWKGWDGNGRLKGGIPCTHICYLEEVLVSGKCFEGEQLRGRKGPITCVATSRTIFHTKEIESVLGRVGEEVVALKLKERWWA